MTKNNFTEIFGLKFLFNYQLILSVLLLNLLFYNISKYVVYNYSNFKSFHQNFSWKTKLNVRNLKPHKLKIKIKY